MQKKSLDLITFFQLQSVFFYEQTCFFYRLHLLIIPGQCLLNDFRFEEG